MVGEEVGAVAVLQDEVLVGMLSERDLVVKIMDRDLDPYATKVSEIMVRDPMTMAHDATRGAALKLMLTRQCRHLPVTDEDGRVLGMISLRQLLRERLRHLRGQMDSVVSYMAADGPGG